MARTRHPAPEFRMHKTISEGDFAPGAAFLQAATIRALVPLTSASKARIRFKASRAGTLAGKFLRPGIRGGEYASFWPADDLENAEVCTTGNPSDVSVTANTEAMMEFGTMAATTDLAGEAWLLLEFTEGNVGAGTVTYCNVSQL